METKEKTGKDLPAGWLAALGAVLLALLWFSGSKAAAKLESVRAEVRRIESAVEASGAAIEELRALKELRVRDVENYKKTLQAMARSKKKVYEAGASLQEEKRLLEKQLELMTTYLEIKEETGKISVMRGDHSLKDYPFQYSPLKIFGAAAQPVPSVARIISKERFAHPQRGRVEETNGSISWEPPQVGLDPRSGALGEFVLFTDGPLIIHGPPPRKELHGAFPHACPGVTAYTARRLFEAAFVGTKILYAKKKKPLP